MLPLTGEMELCVELHITRRIINRLSINISIYDIFNRFIIKLGFHRDIDLAPILVRYWY